MTDKETEWKQHITQLCWTAKSVSIITNPTRLITEQINKQLGQVGVTNLHRADTWHLHEALSARIAHSPHTVLTEVTEPWQLHTSQSRHVTLAQSTQRKHCALPTHRPHRNNRTLTTTRVTEQTRDTCTKHSVHALHTPHTLSSQR